MSDFVKILPYSIDLSKPLDKTEMHTLFVIGDSQAHRLELEIRQDGAALNLDGSTVTGYFTNFREDATVEVTGSVENGKAVVTLSKPCYTLHGQFVLIIQIKSGEVETSVFLGEGFMRRSKAEKIVYDDYIVYDVNTLLAQINAMKTATANANTATGNANTAAEDAQTKANRAQAMATLAGDAATMAANAANKINGMTVSAEKADGAGAVISEVNGVKHIAFSLPKGDTGATPQITFEVETGAPGTNVQITQGGTAENPLIHLTIPRGDTGAIDGVDYYAGAPAALGVASPGNANGLARGDHVHPMPTAEQVGARPDTWTPTASDVGALAQDARAADSAKLGGFTLSDIILKLFPEGTIYLSTLNISPASLFGGTWEQLKDRFLLAAGDTYTAGDTGGEATHALTVDEIPEHRHMLRYESTSGSTEFAIYTATSDAENDTGNNETTGLRRYTTYTGGSQAHNNMPPYLVVYAWKRVS